MAFFAGLLIAQVYKKTKPQATSPCNNAYRYYKCHGKDTVARDRACRCTQTPAKVDELDAAVWGHVESLLEDPGALAARFEESARLSEARGDDGAAVQRREARLRRLDREEQRLVDAYQAGVIEVAELKTRREQVQGRRQVLTTRRDQEQRLQVEQQAARAIWSGLGAFCRRVRTRLDEATLAERQRTLQMLIERAIVGEDSLEIRHAIPLGHPGEGPRAADRRGRRGRVASRGQDPRRHRGASRIVDCVRMVHLRRDFQAMIDRGGDGEAAGRRLLTLSNRLFRHWHRVRDGTLEWGPFRARMDRLRREVKQALVEGTWCPCAKTAATCFVILKVEEGLWAFARVKGVEPTNNAVERALRHAVIWRRTSGGTDSPGGSRFVERMLTGVATCRQQGRDVLDYRGTCFEADRQRQPLPSLLPVVTAVIEAA